MLQNAFNFIVKMKGFSVTIKCQNDLSVNTVIAAQSNYFRKPGVDENIVGTGREYVLSKSFINFVPQRGDTFTISNTEFYTIIEVKEMRGFSDILGYRLILE